MVCSFRKEARLRASGFVTPAGVDEVGRGCLFGPVAAAAVILPVNCRIPGIRDSKLIPYEERLKLSGRIRQEAIAFSVAFASVEEILEINILQASRLAMRRAVEALSPQPDYLLVDFVRIDTPIPQDNIVKGDAISKLIAAASILAKVERDLLLASLHDHYPQYGLASNKGYGTPDHLAALLKYGPTPQHRSSFAPVRAAIQFCRKQEQV